MMDKTSLKELEEQVVDEIVVMIDDGDDDYDVWIFVFKKKKWMSVISYVVKAS